MSNVGTEVHKKIDLSKRIDFEWKSGVVLVGNCGGGGEEEAGGREVEGSSGLRQAAVPAVPLLLAPAIMPSAAILQYNKLSPASVNVLLASCPP